jgi:hypothetical protein
VIGRRRREMESPPTETENPLGRARSLIGIRRVQGIFLPPIPFDFCTVYDTTWAVRPHPKLFVASFSKSRAEKTYGQPFYRRINPPDNRRTTPCGPSRIAGGYHTCRARALSSHFSIGVGAF